MIPIENEKRIDWRKIRAEYIGGGISQKKIADKYGVSYDTLIKRANKEGWATERAKAYNETAKKAQEKAAEAAADNATIAESIKKTMLLRLLRIAENYPKDATEIRRKEDGAYCLYRIKDIAEAYKALTDDMPKTDSAANELLQSLIDLERGRS